MQPYLARKREQRQRVVKVESLQVGALRDGGAFRFLAAILFAELDVRAEAAGAERHVKAGLGISAEQFRLGAGRRLVAGIGQLAGETAFGIVGAADEGAELADLKAQAPDVAGRAGSGIESCDLVG